MFRLGGIARAEPIPRARATHAIIRITSTAICGSDLHLYEALAPLVTPGDIIGHELIGIVEETGSAVTNLKPGDRVVVPLNGSCGHCYYCQCGLQLQCETTQVTEYLCVPHADCGPINVGRELSDEHYLFLSDILPTDWQAMQYAQLPQRRVMAARHGVTVASVEDVADPLGVTDFVTHRMPLEQAPKACRMFQQKHDGCIKVVLQP